MISFKNQTLIHFIHIHSIIINRNLIDLDCYCYRIIAFSFHRIVRNLLLDNFDFDYLRNNNLLLDFDLDILVAFLSCCGKKK